MCVTMFLSVSLTNDHVGLSVRVCALHRVSVRVLISVQVSGSVSVRGVSVTVFCS